MNSDQRAKPNHVAPVDGIQIAGQVAANTAAAIALFQALYDGLKNMFLSPYSISLALAMLYAGARSGTARQMASALYFELEQEQLPAAFAILNRALASRPDIQLQFTQGLWGRTGRRYLAEFQTVLAEQYGAPLQELDLGRPEEARQIINEWAEVKTGGRVPELIPPGTLGGKTELVLGSAAYFLGRWAVPFDSWQTSEGPFHLADGGQVSVPFMHRTAVAGYYRRSEVQVIELDYFGHGTSMVILLPDGRDFDGFVGSLRPGLRNELYRLVQCTIDLALPRFRLSAGYRLSQGLKVLGLVDAFGRAADFSGIDDTRDLFIDEVYHQAFVNVDEEGTEAAAATGASMIRGIPRVDVTVRIDRPFLFLIRDKISGSLLFIGQVADPAAS